MYETIEARLKHNIDLYAGYSPNTDFDYSELSWALNYHINNIGDHFNLKNGMSSHDYEQEVIKWFLNLFGSNTEDGWGYTTTGGTEGIIFGMWRARDNFPDAIVYMSDQAHYAVQKAANILNISHILITTDSLGQMDYDDLEKKLNKRKPAIVIATLGTTVTSAKDDIKKIKTIADSKKISCYIHADAAFDGMILPFVKTNFSYRLDQDIDSISISGHKLIGSPIPSGVVLIKKQYIEKKHISYIYTFDCTLSGSRSGLATLILWSSIKKHGHEGYKLLVEKYLERAKNVCSKINSHGISAWRFNDAITIVLEKQPEVFLNKWIVPSNEKQTSIVTLPRLTDQMVQEIIDDILSLKKHGRLSVERKYLHPEIGDSIKL